MSDQIFEYLEGLKGISNKQLNLVVVTDNCTINLSGKFRKHGEQYSFVKGKKKFVIERRKAGNLWTWKGTHHEYWIQLFESGELLFEYKIPQKAEFQIADIEANL